MSYDLGVKNGNCGEIDERFDLVMILERFEESLVLLKHLNCWQFEDVAFTRVNEGKRMKQRVTNETIEVLKELLDFEYDLYHYFSRKLGEKARRFGERKMEIEIRTLKLAMKRLNFECRRKCSTKIECKVSREKSIVQNCSCEKFDFCHHCQSMRMLGVDLNIWAHCIQEGRLGKLKKRLELI